MKLNCVMLVDDNYDDNFFHERVLQKTGIVKSIVSKQSGLEALDYLNSNKGNKVALPDLIFLDINMPGMNGWEFLDEYNKLDDSLKSRVIIVMLTSSESVNDKKIAKSIESVLDFRTKPLTSEMVKEIIDSNFSEQDLRA